MNCVNMPKLVIGDLEVSKPIIQGGMGVGISMSGLASAVANEGGIGVISTVGLGLLNKDKSIRFKEANKKSLIDEIRKARLLSRGVLGANLMVALSDYDEMLKVAFDEKLDIVFLGAGLPLKLPTDLSIEYLKASPTKVAIIVSSARAADLIFRTWSKNFHHVPDAVVVEGPLAGGHLGFKKAQIDDPAYKLEKIIPDVIKAIETYENEFGRSIPVIAAGGIYTGADIYKFIEMGARGVQMATRFVATHECDASIEFKEAYVNCTEDDITIIESPVGLPGRAIRNQFLDEVSAGIRKPFKCPWKCLKTCDFREAPYCIANALTNAQKGILHEGFTFAGANAYRVNEIISVKELFQILESEYEGCSIAKVEAQAVA
ncbi:MAG: nitronate monooxygenase [Bacteroidetes bacterium]|nr:nitronate monooxygenase [Bacteroidota bacterium]